MKFLLASIKSLTYCKNPASGDCLGLTDLHFRTHVKTIVFSTIAFKIARQALVRSHSWSKIEIIEVRIIEFKKWGVAYVVISLCFGSLEITLEVQAWIQSQILRYFSI
jgi:hypothetical protein